MATSDLEKLAENWASAWSSHKTEKLLALFTDDCMFEDVTFGVVMRGKEELRAFVDGAFAAVPDIKFKLTNHFAGRRSAVMEWVMSGTHKGDFPGLPRTGKSFSVRGATIVDLRAGKIQRESDYWDAATFMKQVGLLPSQ